MNFLTINSRSRNAKKEMREIDRLRAYYSRISLQSYFEPIQVKQVDNTKKNDKMQIMISEPDDINSWISCISQNCIVKMRHLEDSIYNLINCGDLYSSAILIRHHMELSGLICLSIEVLLENDIEKLQRFISKTFFGSSFYNNPKLREGFEAFTRTETPTVSAMIAALNRFLMKNTEGDTPPEYFTHMYAFLCQFSHPSTDTATFFVDSEQLPNGTKIQFRWEPNFGKTGLYKTLGALRQSIHMGLTGFFIFTSYKFTYNGVQCDMEKINLAYEILTSHAPEE